MSIERRTLLTILDVPVTADALSWQFVPPKLVIGIIVAWITNPTNSLWGNLGMGIINGLLILLLLILHILGHILASKRVTPAMTEARITPILIETRYDNDSDTVPPQVHLIRSLGGPIMNLCLALFTFIVSNWINTYSVLFFAYANLVFFIGIILPLPTIDGIVIWRSIGQMRKS